MVFQTHATGQEILIQLFTLFSGELCDDHDRTLQVPGRPCQIDEFCPTCPDGWRARVTSEAVDPPRRTTAERDG